MDKQLFPEVDALASKVGEFIHYWGFKKIHGRTWCHVYLNKEPLCAGELIERLGVSKALMSQTLSELIEYEVLVPAESCNKKRCYISNPEIGKVIISTVRMREKRLLSDTYAAFRNLEAFNSDDLDAGGICSTKLKRLGRLIEFADRFLNSFLKFGEFSFKSFLDIFH